MIDHEDFRHGSAHHAERSEIARAGLLAGHGMHLAYIGKERISLDGDAPWIFFAGSGSGKCRDVLAETIIRSASTPFLVFDPKGELAAITIASFIRWRAFMYLWNPCGLHGLPQGRMNSLDILDPSSPRYHADVKFVAAGLIPVTSGREGRYFELRAREWVEALLKSVIERDGCATFPAFWRVVQMIEGDGIGWDAHLTRMEASADQDVRACAHEIWSKQQKPNSNECGAILGTIKANLAFLSDPMLQASLENPTFSLKHLTGEQLASIFVLLPREYIRIWAPVLRVIFVVTMLYKSRAPLARRVTIIADEAGQMGNFEALLEAFTYGRGAGVRTFALFQDIGQITANFGAPAVQSFLGSSQVRGFFGVRDPETPLLISRLLGNETLSYEDTLQRENARHARARAMQAFVNGCDPFAAAFDAAHYGRVAENRVKMQRPLMTPDEIMHMSEDEMTLFVSGLDLHPIRAKKYPHYTLPDLNGQWLPTPGHPPYDSVRLPGGLWARRRAVVTEAAPAHLAHYPQHENGVRYVEGFRPW